MTAAISASAVIFPLMALATSLRQSTALYAAGSVPVAVAMWLAIDAGDRFWILAAAAMALLVVVFSLRLRRSAARGAVRTEELVGRTVSDAERLLGYPKDLQPAGMATPTLVAVPEGAAPSDLGDPAVRADLVVTAVALDPAIPSITFGVAPPHTVRRRDVTREEMQAELVARVGGHPGSLRPERRVLGAPTPG